MPAYINPKVCGQNYGRVTGPTKNNNGDFECGEAKENREKIIFRPRRNN